MSHKTNHQYIRQLAKEKRSNALQLLHAQDSGKEPHIFLDRFRSKQFCGFLLLWVDDRSEEVFFPFIAAVRVCVTMQMFGFLSPFGYTEGQNGAALTFCMFYSCTQGHWDAIMLSAHKTYFDRVYISHLWPFDINFQSFSSTIAARTY